MGQNSSGNVRPLARHRCSNLPYISSDDCFNWAMSPSPRKAAEASYTTLESSTISVLLVSRSRNIDIMRASSGVSNLIGISKRCSSVSKAFSNVRYSRPADASKLGKCDSNVIAIWQRRRIASPRDPTLLLNRQLSIAFSSASDITIGTRLSLSWSVGFLGRAMPTVIHRLLCYARKQLTLPQNRVNGFLTQHNKEIVAKGGFGES
jgi:hypothetical protein